MENFKIGTAVVVKGLKNMKKYNGKDGHICTVYNPAKGKYGVKLVGDGNLLALSPVNLVKSELKNDNDIKEKKHKNKRNQVKREQLSSKKMQTKVQSLRNKGKKAQRKSKISANKREDKSANKNIDTFNLGISVVLKKLKNSGQYNGKKGHICTVFNSTTGRYGVKLDGSEKILAIRPSNMNISKRNKKNKSKEKKGRRNGGEVSQKKQRKMKSQPEKNERAQMNSGKANKKIEEKCKK